MIPKVFPDHEAMSQAAARCLQQELRERPSSLLCLATGGTPGRAYDVLREQARANLSLFRRARLLKLDDWGGLEMDDPGSSEYYLQQHLVRPLRLQRRYTAFLSNPTNPQKECARIRAWLQRHGPIDVCVLGLGLNGHLAFNEPAPFLQPHAHVARLSAASLRHSMVALSRTKPRYGLTLGMADLLQARHVLLLVSGKAKRSPLTRLLQGEGQITPRFPATFLWLHPNVTLLCDRAARPG